MTINLSFELKINSFLRLDYLRLNASKYAILLNSAEQEYLLTSLEWQGCRNAWQGVGHAHSSDEAQGNAYGVKGYALL